MKTIVRKLDDGSGVVILPQEMLDNLNMRVGDQFQIIETDDGVILRPMRSDDVERQMRAARDVMDQYEAVLQRMAK
ncbi:MULTISPECIES: AbrB/MazE/SpoVT family DNA-binding domain-containing protein [unclassified Mesorhizobium]|uniref:AbrB/MazE/SpoVT family DNA-binding domain-containing protein n=1 Tax=unclassified Mesorhizobium TaxID=325217 RepID=UPI000FD2CC80|nr:MULTISPECIES: AbrB/MazE/SpoVT family DNA-binding domain-containing protein [unclassified Mesorhizobium]RUX10278.1 AbrB/MazE/SpoVT family DNA-binding domain-containing protein [Mesorhizobium sp. M8A.F.Ca.ET.059.01.1.1]TGR58859.1 AbrB/MazE/SpoVT family DNA-binding domain-containing protein [bacterium M00.F.Ca.ET.199.01.1.1]TGU41032.1 AbrB/MazE/SpoVT family DNA-binding domain-containing protein [bacterium M00.F.Ca.ET.156.01.1.1]TGV53523.1 AbrB/MazE/SpoVT family DNA-binding domain-containing pro